LIDGKGAFEAPFLLRKGYRALKKTLMTQIPKIRLHRFFRDFWTFPKISLTELDNHMKRKLFLSGGKR